MCGIVGYIGKHQAAPIILEGLAKLEYRGYDSTGMAVFDGKKINIQKAAGRLQVLENMTRGGETMPGCVGIGHTRWATHGKPTDINAHPHDNQDGTIAVVHNGIIENYQQLKQRLINRGYKFVSDTDTEVLVQLIDYYYKGNPLEAITKVLHRVEGSYALGILFADHPEEIFAVRKDCPLIVGTSSEGSFIASDVPAILKYTREVYYIDNQEVVALKENEIHFYTVDEEEIQKTPSHVDWDAEAVAKGGYEHFMLKEIYDQPRAVRETFEKHMKDGNVEIEELYQSGVSNIRSILSPVFDGKSEPLSAANCYTFREIPNLFLLPGHIAFSEYDATYNIAENLTGSLAVFQNVPGALRYMLEITAEKYKLDYILLDMSPSISATNANILMQSDYFFIPCAPDYFCYMAIESLSDTFPKWRQAYQKMAQLDAFKKATYKMKTTPPTFIGTIQQRYRPRNGLPAKAFAEWIDNINRLVCESLVPSLKACGMCVAEEKTECFLEPYNLANISDFNSLIAQAQEHRVPVFC